MTIGAYIAQNRHRLNNMSAPASTTISWEAPAQRLFGFGILVALPETCKAANERKLLQMLEGETPRTVKAAEQELRRRIQARSLELPLPPVAVITAQALSGDVECTDLLTIMTVLAKSSSRVYLRDKDPNLASIVPGRRLILIVPKEVAL
jgi:hypothetical protein